MDHQLDGGEDGQAARHKREVPRPDQHRAALHFRFSHGSGVRLHSHATVDLQHMSSIVSIVRRGLTPIKKDHHRDAVMAERLRRRSGLM